jgi:integrase
MLPEQREQFSRYQAGKVKARPSLTVDQHQAFVKMLSVETAKDQKSGAVRVETLAQLYLADRQGIVCEAKQSFYQQTLKLFCADFGSSRIDSITPDRVRAWKRKNTGWVSLSTQRSRVKVILQLCNFAVANGYLLQSPLLSLGAALDSETPEQARDFVISPDDEKALLGALPLHAKRFFQALIGTGRRPDELCNVKKTEVLQTAHGLLWKIQKHKNARKTGKPETIYLTPAMAQLTRELLADEKNQTEYLFATARQQPWTVAKFHVAFKKVRESLGLPQECLPYSCRHTYITRAIINCCPLASIAELVGNSVAVLAKHYSHVENQAQQAFFALAAQATASQPALRVAQDSVA